MTFTVRDLLAIDLLKDAYVLVGAEGLKNKVSFIDVIEVPDIAEWSKPETVYMTTAYPFAGEPETFEKIVKGFIDNHVSALFIKLGRYIEDIPQSVLEIAKEGEFPIVILPTEAVYSPIITAAAQKIYESQVGTADTNQFQQKLNQLIVQNEGISSLAELLAKQLEGEVYVENKNAQLIYSAGGNKFFKQYQAKEWISEANVYYKDLLHYHDYYHTVMSMNLYLGDVWQGSVICIMRGMVKINAYFYDIIKRSAIVMALALNREEAVFAKRYRLEQEMLEDIVNNSAIEEIKAKMRQIDWEMGAEQIFAVINLSKRNEFMERKQFEQYQQKIAYKLNQQFASSGPRGIFIKKNADFICLFNFAQQKEEPVSWLKTWFASFLEEVAVDFVELVLSIGFGRMIKQVESIFAALDEARQAVHIGKKAYGVGKIYNYDEMGVYKLLFTHNDPEKLKVFYRDYLERLVQYDQKHHSNLVDTLELYYQNNANVLATAEQMYIHRNTLNYRLKRASQILGFNIDDVEYKLCISLALRIRKLLNLG